MNTMSFGARPDAGGCLLGYTVICFSHLRWNSVFQRPHHLLTKAAIGNRVYFVEEPVFDDAARPHLATSETPEGVVVVTPVLAAGTTRSRITTILKSLIDELAQRDRPSRTVLWYYTPMALPFTRHLSADLCVYDNMDELSAFRGAPPRMVALERDLFRRADVVFTGGHSLFEAKRGRHANIHAFPSSIDARHFARARRRDGQDCADQSGLPGPRLGFFGVIDERMDLDLVRGIAELRPDWQLVMIGPVAKIDPKSLPRRSNIHWLGARSYQELPSYLSGWNVGIMPFALNESTRFISPTKTPEFLAAGVPVVSTAITDVVRPYGDLGLVEIADDAKGFVAKVDHLLTRPREEWIARVDRHLSRMSWDLTWDGMTRQMAKAMRTSERVRTQPASKAATAYDWLIVGAGFAGSVLAERLASQRGDKVLLIDRRPHIGGNAYDCYDKAGLLVHKYGPHIFHTNSEPIFSYLSQFTTWRTYQHRVLAQVDGQLLPIPINLDTINRLYGLTLTSPELEDWFAARAETVETIATSEDVVVSRIGRELYEKFFRGYTRKQWGVDPSELDKSVTARVPTRTNRDDRYFTDDYQSMPRDGYTRMFEAMLDQPAIDVMLETDFRDVRRDIAYRRLIFTGPIDEYFDFRFGRLPYRSLRFRHVTLDRPWHQPVAVVNYPMDEDYTRVTEYKHLTGQVHPRTSLTYEYPSDIGDPYYPVPRPENMQRFKQYEALARETPDVWFVGRLATYRYYNMDQVVGQALATFRRIEAELPVAHGAGRARPPTPAEHVAL